MCLIVAEYKGCVLRCLWEDLVQDSCSYLIALFYRLVIVRARITLFFSFLTFNTTEEKILYLTPEQEKDKSHFTDKEVCKFSFLL